MDTPPPLPVDVSQSLRDAENALRDFISAELLSALGAEWEAKCGVFPDRIAKWKERKEAESKRQEAGVVDERLIYYADFYDIKTILKKHWPAVFSPALGDWKTLEVYLTELERLRDPDAHRRELLPHQKQLVAGISGEIRTRIVRYRSKRETSDDVFPRIESARDSLGNIWVPNSEIQTYDVHTGMTLRVGDQIDFVLTARDPEDAPLEYAMQAGGIGSMGPWQASPEFTVRLTEQHIAQNFSVDLHVRSNRSFHARGTFDAWVSFRYAVLPKRDA